MLPFSQIKGTTDLRDLVPPKLVRQRYERYLWTLCPFHRDHHPSCLVYADGYRCQACGASGDCFDWLAQLRGCTPAEALQELQGRPVTPGKAPPPPQRQPSARLDESLIWRWHYQLTPQVLAYFTGRGLEPDTVLHYRLGWGVPPGAVLARYTLPRFWQGRCVGVKFRRASDSDPVTARYTHWAGLSDHHPFTPDGGTQLLAGKIDTAVVTEGEFDSMLAFQMGHYALSPLFGAGSVNPELLDALRWVRRLYAIPDRDPVHYRRDRHGREVPFLPGEAFIQRLRQACPRVRVVPLDPPHKDLTDWVVAGHGAGDFATLLRQADRAHLRQTLIPGNNS